MSLFFHPVFYWGNFSKKYFQKWGVQKKKDKGRWVNSVFEHFSGSENNVLPYFVIIFEYSFDRCANHALHIEYSL